MKTMFPILLLGLSLLLITPSDANTTVCTMEYKPVCGKKNIQCIHEPCDSLWKTFSNRCVAKGEGATEITNGECKGKTINDLPTNCITAKDECGNNCIKGKDNTWACTLMTCDEPKNVSICTQYADKIIVLTGSVCNKEYKPVCGKKIHECCKDSGNKPEYCKYAKVACDQGSKTYNNECLANSDGATEIAHGSCIGKQPKNKHTLQRRIIKWLKNIR